MTGRLILPFLIHSRGIVLPLSADGLELGQLLLLLRRQVVQVSGEPCRARGLVGRGGHIVLGIGCRVRARGILLGRLAVIGFCAPEHFLVFFFCFVWDRPR